MIKFFIRTVLLLQFILCKLLIYFLRLLYNNLRILIIIILIIVIIEPMILKRICGILIIVKVKCFLDKALSLRLYKEWLQNISIYYILWLFLVRVYLINKFLLWLRNLLLLQTNRACLKLILQLLIFWPEVWNILSIEYRWLIYKVAKLVLLVKITKFWWLFGAWLNIWRLRYVQFFIFY